jgi:predicted ATPase
MAERLAVCLEIPVLQRSAFVQVALGERPTYTLPLPENPIISPSTPHLPGNLPQPLTRLIGRRAEVKAIKECLQRADVRLVTLTGFGGVGKTRLAIQVADELSNDFSGMVFFVSLAPLNDPDLVQTTIAQSIGLREANPKRLSKRLAEYLCVQAVLLVLDNFEHLMPAVAFISELMQITQSLKIMTTSRMPLQLYGERCFIIQPFDLPDPADDISNLRENDGVALFVERGQAAQPKFELTVENGPCIAKICKRLDGIPLAIELAAARLDLFSPQQLLDRLSDPLKAVRGNASDMPARQRTLRATIDWSYDLLSATEQILFRCLPVFVDGWTLEAAESVLGKKSSAADDALLPDSSDIILLPREDILDLLTGLADKSLIVVEEREEITRFRTLETIRQYAQEKLQASGESEWLNDRHLAFYVCEAEQAESQVWGAQQKAALQRLDMEHNNLRAALHWSLHGTSNPVSRSESGLRLAASLCDFWAVRGYFSEGRAWLGGLTAPSASAASPALSAAWASALYRAAWFANIEGDDLQHAQALAEEALSQCRLIGDLPNAASCLTCMGSIALARDDLDQAEILLEESQTLCRALGAAGKLGLAEALSFLAWVALERLDYIHATALFEEDLALCHELENLGDYAHLLADLGIVARRQGEYKRAEMFFQESLQIAREQGFRTELARTLAHWGQSAHEQGHYEQAQQLIEEARQLYEEMERKKSLASTVVELGAIAWRLGNALRAVTLLQEGLELLRHAGCPVAYAQLCLANVFRSQGDYERAQALYAESLRGLHMLRDTETITAVLRSAAMLARAQGRGEQAVRLFGAAESAQAATGSSKTTGFASESMFGAGEGARVAALGGFTPMERAEYEHDMSALCAIIDEETVTRALNEGRGLTLDQALECAIDFLSNRTKSPSARE